MFIDTGDRAKDGVAVSSWVVSLTITAFSRTNTIKISSTIQLALYESKVPEFATVMEILNFF